MVKSVVNSCLPEFSDFTRVFSPVKVLCNGPLYSTCKMCHTIPLKFLFRINCVYIQCVPEKRKPINQVNFSENCNDLSENVYNITKFSLSSFYI